MILQETYSRLISRFGIEPDSLTLSDCRIGQHMTAVRLSDGSVGIAGSVSDDLFHCDRKNRDFGDFTPGKICGRSVADLFSRESRSGIQAALKSAALNALSDQPLRSGRYLILPDTDPADLPDLAGKKVITIVGAFHTYIQRFSEAGHHVNVLELRPEALSDEHRKFYVPAANFSQVIPDSDLLVVTGLTLVNQTFAGLLAAAGPQTRIILTGPSASMIPDVLFEKGVSFIGATRITEPDRALDIIGQGGAGYHLFRYCAEKICIVNPEK